MFQTEVVIFTLESVISISTNASGFLQSYRVLLIVQQSPHCEIIISLAFYVLLYHSCKHKSVTSQTMDSFHIKQFKFLKINSDLEGFFFDWVGFRVWKVSNIDFRRAVVKCIFCNRKQICEITGMQGLTLSLYIYIYYEGQRDLSCELQKSILYCIYHDFLF